MAEVGKQSCQPRPVDPAIAFVLRRKLGAIQRPTNLSQLGTIEISGRVAAIVSTISIPIAVLTLLGAAAFAAALHPDLGNASVIEIGVPLLLALLATLSFTRACTQ